MTAKSTQGLQTHIILGSASPNQLTPTVISSANPTIITVADTTGMTIGDICGFSATGFTELDGKTFISSVIDGTTFSLLGVDLSSTTGTLDVSPVCDHYDTDDVVLVCLSGLTMNVNEPGTVSTGTFCDPSTSIAAQVQEAGTLGLTGYVDVTSPDYQELLAAEKDGNDRTIRVTLPSNGYLIAPFTMSNIVWDLPLDGAIGYSTTVVLGSKLQHVY